MASAVAANQGLKRADDWETRLDRFIAQHQGTKFAWNENDCCTFSCDAVRAMTGVDLAADFRNKYDSALSAARMLKAYGGTVEMLAEEIADQFGIWEVPVLYAQRGDVVLLPSNNDGPALGVVSLDGWNCLGAGPDGLVKVPLSACLKAWRI